MPELPEVQTIVTDLKGTLIHYRIKNVTITPGYKVNPDDLSYKKALIGSRIEDVHRVGKNVVIKLNTGYYLTFHLAMTGRILIRSEQDPADKYQKVQITLIKGREKILLRFCDMRMFGRTGVLLEPGLQILKAKYGPDLYRDELAVDTFLLKIQSKNTAIKVVLLEQSIITGLGNIYATDALWLAGMHPETRTKAISLDRAKSLLESARQILSEGVLHRGSTLEDRSYVDIFGKPGQQQNHFRVYGKTTCPKCKTKIEYKKVGGRGTYYCPVCQT